jgi:hypothetical protein
MSVVPQSDHRIHFRRPPRRDVTGNESDDDQQQGDKSAGSVALTWKSRFFITRVRARAAANPSATPAKANLIPWLTTIRSTSPACAPRAIRMPISCVRRLTAYEMTP